MPTTRVRDAARVIILDEANRILLMCYGEDDEVYWGTPGGALEPGETHVQAAVRELSEELGIEAEIGAEVATREKDHLILGEHVRQVERYFIAQIPAQDVEQGHATDTDNILCWEWWELSELDSTNQTVYPAGLADLVMQYLTDGAPDLPIVL
ncbi:NUDIX hydrolase [Microtetraspora malaysiensis]|uniref:NUDIX hydrolase n=1 Tax=Microtetraspora malaysiensis TaxID=161358 RepID=UPI003D8E2108